LRRGGMRLLTALTRGAGVRGRLRFARAVNRWVMPPGGMMLSALPGGLVMELDLNDDLQLWFHYLGDYETLERAFILSRLPGDGVFLDVGANVGWHTLHAAQHLVSGRVIAFEPVSWNLERLARNLELNGLRNVQVFPFALSDTEGPAEINSSFGGSGNATLAPRAEGTHVETISCVRLDDHPAGRSIDRIDVVKIDVEGAELRALRGMEATLARCGRPPILCEINPSMLRLMGTSAAEVQEEASRMGYAPYRLLPGPSLEPLDRWPGENQHENIVLSRVP
jgi:FkbM family methyltransferase